jgi:hypothetical protein
MFAKSIGSIGSLKRLVAMSVAVEGREFGFPGGAQMTLRLALDPILWLVANRRHKLHDLVHAGSEPTTGPVAHNLADFELVIAQDRPRRGDPRGDGNTVANASFPLRM